MDGDALASQRRVMGIIEAGEGGHLDWGKGWKERWVPEILKKN